MSSMHETSLPSTYSMAILKPVYLLQVRKNDDEKYCLNNLASSEPIFKRVIRKFRSPPKVNKM